ncbi:MAG: YdhK family protein [Micrococcales bacterium]|uniref:YdhK family protein n=1 Tax=Kocuria palustris TaxID=71999 RepID=UPI00077B7923|nr:YdhK family protein [Kocuria palustris]MDN5703634.1 YdhK family protein [Micrococcales bacterium]
MNRTFRTTGAAAAAAAGLLLLSACGTGEEDQSAGGGHEGHSAAASSTSESSGAASDNAHEGHSEEGGHAHNPDGGPAPEGIQEASDPTFAVGDTVRVTADHMPGMEGAEATVSGAFDTTTYAVSYTPTDGGEPVEDHKWVVHEELQDPGEAPLADGTEVVLQADHMEGMEGAEATIDSSTDETVYMVDMTMDGMEMTNHKWVVDSELEPVE